MALERVGCRAEWIDDVCYEEQLELERASPLELVAVLKFLTGRKNGYQLNRVQVGRSA